MPVSATERRRRGHEGDARSIGRSRRSLALALQLHNDAPEGRINLQEPLDLRDRVENASVMTAERPADLRQGRARAPGQEHRDLPRKHDAVVSPPADEIRDGNAVELGDGAPELLDLRGCRRSLHRLYPLSSRFLHRHPRLVLKSRGPGACAENAWAAYISLYSYLG